MKEIIEDIRKSLEGGVTLSKCFEKYPQYFDNIYVNLIKAGEASGKLDIFLLKLVDSLEKRNPNVLENHITWITTQEDGKSMTTIHPRVVELDTYSSQALQIAVLSTMILTGIYSWQKMKETTPSSAINREEE